MREMGDALGIFATSSPVVLCWKICIGPILKRGPLCDTCPNV